MIFIYGTLREMIISLGVFFHVFKVFDFVGKRAKNDKMTKKLCLSRFISQES